MISISNYRNSISFEHSKNKNNFGEIVTSDEKLTADSNFECKVHNISLEGMHIECDNPYGLGEIIDLNSYNTVNYSNPNYLVFPDAKIRWTKDRQGSDFMYSYGVQFTEPIQFKEEFVPNTKEEKQFIFLPDILGILGFTLFLVYCILRIFSGLKLIPEPFDLFIIGFGLIGFAHFIRIIAKDHIEDDVIKNRPADSRSKMLII